MTNENAMKKAKKLWGKKAQCYFAFESDHKPHYTVGRFNLNGPISAWGWKLIGEGDTWEKAFADVKKP